MYIPATFRITDVSKLAAFIDRYSFATLVTNDGTTPFATHLPMRLVRSDDSMGTLLGHLARANPQWQHFQTSAEVLVMFQGPHSYISPSWYAAAEAVPTWNYAAVHVYGRPRVIEDRTRVEAILNELIDFYESGLISPWKPILSEEYRSKMIQAIVAFEIQITRIEGKFKLGQNRDMEDIRRVHEALSDSVQPDAQALAALMRSELQGLDANDA